MRVISYLFMLFLILLGVTFACLNAEPVLINFYVGTGKVPLSMLLVFALIFGVGLGLLAGFILYLKLKSKNARLRQRLNLAEKEVSNLRSIPVKNRH